MRRTVIVQSVANSLVIVAATVAGSADASVTGQIVVNRTVIYQGLAAAPQVVPPSPITASVGPTNFDPIKAPSFNASRQQFGGFVFVPKSIPDGTQDLDQPFLQKSISQINAEQQQFTSFCPAGTIVSTTPQGAFPQQPYSLIPPYKAALQQFVSFAPAGTIVSVTPQGNQSQWPELFQLARSLGPAKPLGAEQQQFSAYPPQGSVPTVFVPAVFSESPWALVKPYKASLQQFGA